jgi:hypothetical protein
MEFNSPFKGLIALTSLLDSRKLLQSICSFERLKAYILDHLVQLSNSFKTSVFMRGCKVKAWTMLFRSGNYGTTSVVIQALSDKVLKTRYNKEFVYSFLTIIMTYAIDMNDSAQDDSFLRVPLLFS